MKPFVLVLLTGALFVHCATSSPSHLDDRAPICAATSLHETTAPRVNASMEEAEVWLGRLPEGEADRVLLSPEAITALNGRNRAADLAAHQDVVDDAVRDDQRVAGELDERLAWLDQKLRSGSYVEEATGAYGKATARIKGSTVRDTLHVVAAEADIRCVPMDEGLFTSPMDRAFDRNRCSRLHVGEVVRVLREADAGQWLYVHAGHSVGWLHSPTLTPDVAATETEAFRGVGEHLVVTNDVLLGGRVLRMGRRFPVNGQQGEGWSISLPTTTGFESVHLPEDAPVHVGPMPLTRANVWRLALARLDEPYGWGGYEGGRDCSRLLLDLFSVFGLRLGRHSRAQAHAGSVVHDLTPLAEADKAATLRKAATEGIVLAYMPGHIMLHLGDLDGSPHALSAISEYVRPCAGGEQVVRLDRATISDYELGRGTERTAFIERLTTLAVFGGP